MTPRPLLLDLFCGAGGAAMGYWQAGFDVYGVDNRPQPNYPFGYRIDDALNYLRRLVDGADIPFGLDDFVAIHTSPPCQAFTQAQNTRQQLRLHADLLEPLRRLLNQTGLPYVIENVWNAPLRDPIRVCMAQHLRHDGFELRRHRYFETNWPAWSLACGCGELPAAPVFGHSANADFRGRHGRDFGADDKRSIMGVPWMRDRDEVSEAIPPAFAEFVGGQLLDFLRVAA